MRRKEDRTSQILDLLVRKKKLEVAELSQHLGVSSYGTKRFRRHGVSGTYHQRTRLCRSVRN